MIAGPSDLAGFIEAPLTGPPNSDSNVITAPIATPAKSPFSFSPKETLRITNINRSVRIHSNTKLCRSDPRGTVAPSDSFNGKSTRIAPLAARAPVPVSYTHLTLPTKRIV